MAPVEQHVGVEVVLPSQAGDGNAGLHGCFDQAQLEVEWEVRSAVRFLPQRGGGIQKMMFIKRV